MKRLLTYASILAYDSYNIYMPMLKSGGRGTSYLITSHHHTSFCADRAAQLNKLLSYHTADGTSSDLLPLDSLYDAHSDARKLSRPQSVHKLTARDITTRLFTTMMHVLQ